MIEKLKLQIKESDLNNPEPFYAQERKACKALIDTVNQLVDAVNAIQKERELERFEIQEWIGIVSDLRSRVPVVESRVSILEEHAHPTAETPDYDDTDDIAGVKNENLYTKSIRMDKEFAEDECVRLQKELNYTQKALDVAVDALKEIIDWDKCVALQSNDFVGIANKALEQITALEQKDK